MRLGAWVAAVCTVALASGLSAPPSWGAREDVRRFRAEDVPHGEGLQGVWVDVKRQVLHDGDAAVPIDPPLKGTVWSARQVVGGVVVETSRLDLVYLGFDGSQRVLTRDVGNSWAVEDSGVRLAYAGYDARSDFVRVVNVHGGMQVAKRRIRDADVFDFAGGVVWMSVPPATGARWRSVAGTWTLATDQVERAAEHLAFADGVDLAAGVAFGAVGVYDDDVRVAPLDERAGWEPWTVKAESDVYLSEDGRLVVTATWSGKDASPSPYTITVRKTRTGKPLQAYYGVLMPDVVWEDGSHFVLTGYRSSGQAALLRFSTGGRVERVSAFGRTDAPIVLAR